MQNLTPQVAKTTLATINTITWYEKPNITNIHLCSQKTSKKSYQNCMQQVIMDPAVSEYK